VVISDIMMPEMNGVELLRKIKEFNNMIKVIMMTGFATNSQLASCFYYGASDCLFKPSTS
jgi:CheY-like chemotaxis protein|tara:strand:+ start:291 stop:470 length:180 start_codon:yes stop_codon:yes gene_type:complete